MENFCIYIIYKKGSGFMNDDKEARALSTNNLWWIFKEMVEAMQLTEEEISRIKHKLEEKLYGQQNNT